MWKDTAKYKDCKELCIIIKKKEEREVGGGAFERNFKDCTTSE